VPVPVPVSFAGSTGSVDQRIAAAAEKAGLTPAAYQEKHWRAYFKIKGDSA
jgi:hypothetical protein